jgi:hypothetical protein
MFSRPTDAERERRRGDLLHRAELVRAHGWNDYKDVWSTGEVGGVAALLSRIWVPSPVAFDNGVM